MNGLGSVPPSARVIAVITSSLVACLLAGAVATDGDALDQLMARLGQRQHGHVTFTEQYFAGVLDRPLAASGELFYEAPDRLEKRTLKPRPERLTLENGILIIERRHKQYHVALADYPQAAPYIDSIRATLAGDRPALERVFRVEFSTSGDDWNLLLSPLDARVAAQVATIRIQGSADDINTVTIEFANGDRSIMTLSASLDP